MRNDEYQNWPGTSLMVAAVPCLMALPVDALTAFVFLIGALINGWIWSAIHSEMHRPSDAWFSTTGAYNFLKRWHFLHHRHPGTNFNTAFPMWDLFLGTIAVMNEEDRKEIEIDTWRVRPTLDERQGGSVAERF